MDDEQRAFYEDIVIPGLAGGPRTPAELALDESAAAIDEVLEWLADAKARGLVEPVHDQMWHLTDAGRAWHARCAAEHRSIRVELPSWSESDARLPRATRAIGRLLGRVRL